ncbi:hypothetical protein JCM33374_g4465 [Metschnikowia sp. JCM 33374]|nr:hypothetical protein JCM33374_g4465 [Metschnikowia sp. JCM 33374]
MRLSSAFLVLGPIFIMVAGAPIMRVRNDNQIKQHNDISLAFDIRNGTESFEEVPSGGIHSHKRGINNGQGSNKVRQFDDLLEWLIRCLRWFLHGNMKGFKMVAESLGGELSNVNEWARGLSLSKENSQSLEYARRIFHVMMGQIEISESTNISDTLKLIFQGLNSLHMSILSLYNSDGKPDLERKDYGKIVSNLAGTLEYLGESYEELDSVPFGVSLKFESQFIEAKKTLQVLASHASFRERENGSVKD